jgi:uncharacterized membrane protein
MYHSFTRIFNLQNARVCVTGHYVYPSHVLRWNTRHNLIINDSYCTCRWMHNNDIVIRLTGACLQVSTAVQASMHRDIKVKVHYVLGQQNSMCVTANIGIILLLYKWKMSVIRQKEVYRYNYNGVWVYYTICSLYTCHCCRRLPIAESVHLQYV